jgi:hypothetical protein
MGVNRFECRTCPYEDVIGDKSYYEKTDMKQKEVEDVFGGANEFANADSVGSKSQSHTAWNLPRIISGPWRGRIANSSFFFLFLQLNVRRRTAMGTVHTSSSCRFVAPTSR